MSIGLQRGTVQILPYDPQWAHEYELEKQRLMTALGDTIIAIEHVGRTSVPGLAAKPLIDIVVAIDSFERLPAIIHTLTAMGYEHMPERVSDERAFFPKGPRQRRTHHLSFVLQGSDGWRQTITFRDYLRQHPERRNAYAALKQQLASAHADDRYAYTAAKHDFIEQTLHLALLDAVRT